MAKTIYNEGRVVGYSAYEQYVKQAIEENPDGTPATEREWLASTIAMGSSMLLKISEGTGKEDQITMLDVKLPSNTRLCAANNIIAYYFDGEGHYEDNSVWADRIVSYGTMINNTSSSSPNGAVGPTDDIPYTAVTSEDEYLTDLKSNLMQYSKIIDGIVIQPGTWNDAISKPPQKDLDPDLNSYPRIRLLISGIISKDINILFTGFTNKVVIQGTSGLDTSTGTSSPQDGDFLGAAAYPWANKITFITPSSLTYFIKDGFKAAEGMDDDLPYNNVIIHKDEDTLEISIEVQKQITSAKGNLIVNPENNRHQADTELEVLNDIHALKTNGTKGNSDYLKVDQTVDQSQTGIQIVPNQMVHSGLGIQVTTEDDGSVTLTNLFPNYTDQTNMISVYPNVEANKDDTNSYYSLWMFNGWQTAAYTAVGYNVMSVQINPGTTETGELISCGITISAVKALKLPWMTYYISCRHLCQNVQTASYIRHGIEFWKYTQANQGDVYSRCVIGRIRFYDRNNKYKLASCLADAASLSPTKYRFKDTTSGGSGIWNLKVGRGFSFTPSEQDGTPSSYNGVAKGVSWNVDGGFMLLTQQIVNEAQAANSYFYNQRIKTGLCQAGDLLMVVGSVADGYNWQFDQEPYSSAVGSGEVLFTVDNNWETSGLIYKF